MCEEEGMKLIDWLKPKPSKIKTGFDIDKYLKDKAERKRIRKGMRRLEEERMRRLRRRGIRGTG